MTDEMRKALEERTHIMLGHKPMEVKPRPKVEAKVEPKVGSKKIKAKIKKK